MKTTIVLSALALALTTGTAFAQTAPADASAAPTASEPAKKKAHSKKVSKKKAKKSTQSMGAGAAQVETDLNAGARRARMDEAYANWQKGT